LHPSVELSIRSEGIASERRLKSSQNCRVSTWRKRPLLRKDFQSTSRDRPLAYRRLV